MVLGIYNNLFCGVAAVIAFFVISGFCIHYPFTKPDELPLKAFYTRRYIRILVPLTAALALGWALGEDMLGFYQAIIWSLVAELAYYTIYPLLRPPMIHWMRAMTVLAYGAALCVIALYPRALNFHEFGPWLTWIVGLPSWLLGCRLAAWAVTNQSLRRSAPWMWRAAVWVFSSAASMLRFHANIGYPFTLTLLGVLVYYWVREEIRWYRTAAPPASLETLGKWSYSVYLVHGLAALGFVRLGFVRLGFGTHPDALWVLQTATVYILSFAFFLLVERPSHGLARRVAKAVSRRV